MKNCVVLAAVAGIASGASGQVATLDMVADGVWDGDNRMTLSVFVDSDYSRPGFDVTHVVMAQYSLNAIGENSTVVDVSMIEGPGWEQDDDNLVDAGYDGNGGHAGFAMNQIYFLPFIRPDDLSSFEDGPVFLAKYEITLSEPITSETELGWEFGEYLEYGNYPYTLTLFDYFANPNGNHQGGEEHPVYLSDIELGSFYIPSPSGLAIVGFSGLFVGRRQRKGRGWSL